MLPPVCITCGLILADKELLLENGKNLILNEDISEKKKIEKIGKLLDKLGFERYCCRSRATTVVDQCQLIK